MKINEKELGIDERIRKNNDLSELLSMKEKCNMLEKDIKTIDKKTKEQINKIVIKASIIGKYGN